MHELVNIDAGTVLDAPMGQELLAFEDVFGFVHEAQPTVDLLLGDFGSAGPRLLRVGQPSRRSQSRTALNGSASWPTLKTGQL